MLSSLHDFIEFPFLYRALMATILLALTCGLLSPLIIAKRYAFLGSAVSHSTLLGLSLGLYLSGSNAPLSLFLWTLSITLVLSLFLAKSTWRQPLPSDTLIGLFFTGTMGLGTLIHSLTSRNSGDLMSFLFGNVLLLTDTDIYISLTLAAIIIPLILIPFNNWILSIYDEEFAILSGVPAKAMHFIFVFFMTALIVSALKISGTILVNALLLAPGFFALSFAKNIKTTFYISVLFSLSTAIIGLVLANLLETPSGATIAVSQLAFLFIGKFITIIKRN